MRLQKHASREVEGKEYYKWVIVIPPEQIEELHWNEGLELESIVRQDRLIVRPMTNPPEKEEKMSYEDFKQIINEELAKESEGLTWTDIRLRRPELYQKVPNNLWVRTLEREIGLRKKKIGTKTIWKLK
jgi:antitoxin component of MazEF toxin-antitoxin module